eukprot:CAMPEP_0197467522 /NCGR_PEP_ID=MMETSP1175-20131217/65612_1 /TAXON_ID=1003142 /ORGANISM="Triceratium dubium, Strain CCMP147" /LENGTH=36 /DNA_ID= /DNA_START= /DNA_END= /DNA_ORIENTATION=
MSPSTNGVAPPSEGPAEETNKKDGDDEEKYVGEEDD